MRTRCIQAYLDIYGDAVVQRVNERGYVSRLPLRLEVVNHSPVGFQWGYCGSGPAQLAVAICMEFLNKRDAICCYQQFKSQVVAGLPQEQPWTLTEDEIKEHLLNILGKNFRAWRL